ncbi:Arylsulfotransferase-domain-containing protein [Xylariomycetidae sp. FL0641]|nr:Arylsulfotransferase-domain-containing protein [Xylariomycetidae sp. FL0641]
MARPISFARLICALLFSLASQPARLSQALYNLGWYGLYPENHYKSYSHASPRLNFVHWDADQCDDGGYYFFAPKGKIVWDSGPVITDARGNLIWKDDKYGMVTDFQVQSYKGERYLTFWSSLTGSFHGYGKGTFYMLDSSYEQFKTVSPVGEGLKGDLHEFRITEEGTALMTMYSSKPADLSAVGGPEKGWVLDSMFQEIDIETGELLFHWSSIEHQPVDQIVRYYKGPDDGTVPDYAFDYFHINSVDKDPEGNYIISGRHTSSIFGISKEDGRVLWQLGGRMNQFKDLSDGRATDFQYQHHVRLHENYTISIFDNAKAERQGPSMKYDHSRGMVVQLDTKRMTATLVQEYFSPEDPKYPDSQGSTQVMDDRVVMGWGFTPHMTEFSLEGDVMCSYQLAPWLTSRWGLVTTYRTFKSRNWVGRPKDRPDVFLNPSDGELFVSWIGATEVDRWVLQGAEWDDVAAEKYSEVATVKKEAFETGFPMESGMPQYLRVAAVDREGNVLSHTGIVDRYYGNAPSTLVEDVVTGVLVLVLALACFAVLYRRRGLRGIKRLGVDGVTRVTRMLSPTRWSSASSSSPSDPENPGRPSRWWKESRGGGGARAHELEPLYED